ncbi:MAG: hypothetical protein HY298_15840 [Verrucomicrobia bacterium]|nr:hypothetical protein [Verrucomicrobiota bacterium]
MRKRASILILVAALLVAVGWLSGCVSAPTSGQGAAKGEKFNRKQALKEKQAIERRYAELLPQAMNRPLTIEEWNAMLQPRQTKFGTFALTEEKILEYLGKPERTTTTENTILGVVETWIYPNYVRTQKAGKTGTLLVAFKSRLVFLVSTPEE